MTEEEVLSKSDKLQDSADRLVEASDIMKTLGGFGEVEFVGSYLNRLLAWPDIDIHIYTPGATVETAFEVARSIFDMQTFGRAEVIKGEVARGNHKEQGSWYLRTKAQEGEFRWNFDIWLFDRMREKYLSDNSDQKYLLEWAKSIDTEQKGLILHAKQQLLIQDNYFPGASVLIYKSVMEDELTSVNDIITAVCE